MANRTFNRPRCLEKELITLACQFGLASDASVVASSLLGRGFTSVTKVSTGLYKLLLQDIFPALIGASVDLITANASTQAKFVEFGDYNLLATTSSAAVVGVSSAASIGAQLVHVRTTDNAGAVSDVSVAATVSVILHLRNSSVV